MLGKLEKLKIEAYTDIEMKSKVPPPNTQFTAYFNPESYSVSYAIEYDEEEAANSTGNPAKFKASPAPTYSFELVIDGTGIQGLSLENPVILPVKTRVENFLGVVYNYNGKIHRPHYLKLAWGDLSASCVLESLDITYTLFAPNGTQLRARLNTSFRDVISYAKMDAVQKANSPDLTHKRVVKQGDTLPNLCYEIYGDPRVYQEVADFNSLTNFRKLQAGQEILFPPLRRE